MASREPETILTLNNVTKGLYDVSGHTISRDVIVLKSVSFDVRRGEVHILLGENGAGKSTLMKILCGAIPADSGEIHLHGKKVNIDRPSQAQDLGVSLVAQEFNLCPNLTAAQSIYLGREPVHGPFNQLDTRKMNEGAQAQLSRLGVNVDARTSIKDLTVPQRQIVEIAKALSLNPEILVMDEPTAALADDQVDRLFDIIRELTRQGVSIIYISHRLNEVTRIGDRATVLARRADRGHGKHRRRIARQTGAHDGRAHDHEPVHARRTQARRARPGGQPSDASAASCVTSHFRYAAARSSAWPGWWAQAAPSWHGQSSAPTPIDSGEIRVFGELVKAHSPRRLHPARRRLAARRPPATGRCAAGVGGGQHGACGHARSDNARLARPSPNAVRPLRRTSTSWIWPSRRRTRKRAS